MIRLNTDSKSNLYDDGLVFDDVALLFNKNYNWSSEVSYEIIAYISKLRNKNKIASKNIKLGGKE